MGALKTQKTTANVREFIETTVDSEQKIKDSFELLALMQEWTGFEPKM